MPKKSTATKSTPKSSNPGVVVGLDDTLAKRKAIRQSIVDTTDTRDVQPLDLELIRPLVSDLYLPIFDHAIKSGDPHVIEIDLCKGTPSGAGISYEGYEFIRGWMFANGKNRTPNSSHYAYLASQFRKSWEPSATHWVLTTEGLVANGGHSGRGVSIAFAPPSCEYGLAGKALEIKDGDVANYIDADSEDASAYLPDSSGYYYVADAPDRSGRRVVFESKMLANPDFARIGCTWDDNSGNTPVHNQDEESGEFEVSFDVPEGFIPPDSLVIRLTINADPSACLKMDDVRLQASMMDFLEMVGPIREFMLSIRDEVKRALPETLLNLYKRLNHSSTGYGILSKGGRPNKSDVQFWFLAFWPQLADSIEKLASYQSADGVAKQVTEIKPPPFLVANQGEKGGVKLFHILVAMAVSSPEGRQRIAIEMQSTATEKTKWTSKQIDWRNKLIGSVGGAAAANADQIVESLVLFGMGKNPLDAFEGETVVDGEKTKVVYPWTTPAGRVPERWDSKVTDAESPQCKEVGEELGEVLASCAATISELLGNDAAKESAARKALPSRRKVRK